MIYEHVHVGVSWSLIAFSLIASKSQKLERDFIELIN